MFKGTTSINMNKATVIAAIQEYLDKRTVESVEVCSVEYKDMSFHVIVQERPTLSDAP